MVLFVVLVRLRSIMTKLGSTMNLETREKNSFLFRFHSSPPSLTMLKLNLTVIYDIGCFIGEANLIQRVQ